MDGSAVVVRLLISIQEKEAFVFVELDVLKQQLLPMYQMLLAILDLQVLPVKDQVELPIARTHPSALEARLGCDALFIAPAR